MPINKKLSKELTFVLILKVVLLFFLYNYFFSHPIEKTERLTRSVEHIFDVNVKADTNDNK